MRLANVVTLTIMVLLASAVEARPQVQMPPVVARGLGMLVTDGYTAALDTWAAKWTHPDDAVMRDQLGEGFRRLVESYGPTRSYDIVDVGFVGERVRIVHAVLVHDRLPVFLRIVAYDSPDGWRVTSIAFNIVMAEVFPESLGPGNSPPG